MEVVLDQRGGGQGLEQTYLNLTLGSMTVTRSHPALGEDSDSDGDIEVPRFQSLDCAEDSDGDLEVGRNRQSRQIVPDISQFSCQVERDVKAVDEIVVLEHMTHTDLAQVRQDSSCI